MTENLRESTGKLLKSSPIPLKLCITKEDIVTLKPPTQKKFSFKVKATVLNVKFDKSPSSKIKYNFKLLFRDTYNIIKVLRIKILARYVPW